MPSTFFGLNIASSGMSTYNAWLNTTGHNIANVKTKGYSKQVVSQQAKVPISLGTSWGMMGSGVDAISILSERDVYYDNKYRLSNTQFGRYETLDYYMDSVEKYLWAQTNESGAITNSMDKFFTGLSSLTESVQDETKRTQTVGFAGTFTKYIKETADTLKDLQKDVNDNIASTVDRVNAYASQIASVTKQINTLEIYGGRANDLRDQRATMIDELSELVDVRVSEKPPAEGKGITQFTVSIGSSVLVDTFDYNTIVYTARDSFNAMNDIDGLYELRWSSGQSFGMHDTDLGGKLQALFEMRDGNNGEVFQGKTTAQKGDTTIKVTDVNELGSSLFKLEIPAEDGVLTIGNVHYEYDYFDCEVTTDPATGEDKYEYTFYLKSPLVKDAANDKVQAADAVDFRGIPYYMSQLDEFIRTFSNAFNEVQTSGYDLYGNLGEQMFIGTDIGLGAEMRFDGTRKMDADKAAGGYKFSSQTTGLNAAGYVESSYYRLTALNTSIDSKIAHDGRYLACADQPGAVSDRNNLTKMLDLEDDKTMFHQGQPASFLQIVTSTIAVDGEKIKGNLDNAQNIKDATEQRRLSKAGVDEDEEGKNLIICQNLLNYQYKVLSVMNEVLDKLINGTAV